MNNLKGNRAPINSIMANNLIVSTQGELITGEESLSPSGIQMAGNIMFGSAVGYTSAGITEADPAMSLVEGLFRPSASGVAADAAVSGFGEVTADVRGRNRPGTGKDVGAEEVSGATSSASFAPFQSSDVGPRVGACYLDALGVPIECSAEAERWAGFPVISVDGDFTLIDTGDWLQYISVNGGWVYVHSLSSWMYMPESQVRENGGWGFVLR